MKAADDTLTRTKKDVKTDAKPEGKTAVKTPPMYRVVLLNDDYTPMDFVVLVLMRVFRKSESEAVRIMLNVHHQGAGICGVYAFEIAETKVAQVQRAAQSAGHPLRCVMEAQ